MNLLPRCALRLAPVMALWALALLGSASAAQVLSLHYQERAPYSSTQADGGVSGLTATPAEQALQRAGVNYAWVLTPSQRQLALIQEGRGLHCGLGWFLNAERSTLGKFSKALYRDPPFGALARNDSGLRTGMRGEEAFASSADVLLVKEGYSYGPQLDRLIARRATPPSVTSAETRQMARMLLAGRASWMIVGAEEAQMLRQDAAAAAGLREVSFAGMSPGETRHLYCSRAVPDAWLARIDQALAAVAR